MSDRLIPDGFVDDLKARVRLSDIVSRRVKLKKQGQGLVGLSPFQNEKTPSFYVYDDKGFYKCFSSGKGGDVIKFVQETERVDFIDAIKRIAEIAGIEIPKPTPKDKEAYDRQVRLLSACETACRFFEQKLTSAEGGAAREYLKGRGLSPNSWKKYRLGYAPDGWRHTLDYLKSLNFTTDELVEAGLVKEKTEDNKKSTYDVFRNRIMFPIENTSGKVIAFGARALEADEKPKYLNSPDSPLFHKSDVLYRYKAARTALSASHARGLIVCEGYMDVIALCEAGIGNAVAPLGTAVTPKQLSMVWHASPEAVLCFDGDSAGQAAAYRTIDRALPEIDHKHQLFFVMLPDGLDPDDIVRRQGRNAMLERIERATPLINLLWHRELSAESLDTPERQAGLGERLMSATESIRKLDVRKAYRQTLLKWANDKGYRLRLNNPRKGKRENIPEMVAIEGSMALKGLGNLLYTIDNPNLLERAQEAIVMAKFPNPDIGIIRDAILDVSDAGEHLDFESVYSYLENSKNFAAAKLLKTHYKPSFIEPNSSDEKIWFLSIEQLVAKDLTDIPVARTNGDKQEFAQSLKSSRQKALEKVNFILKLQEASEAASSL